MPCSEKRGKQRSRNSHALREETRSRPEGRDAISENKPRSEARSEMTISREASGRRNGRTTRGRRERWRVEMRVGFEISRRDTTVREGERTPRNPRAARRNIGQRANYRMVRARREYRVLRAASAVFDASAVFSRIPCSTRVP